MGNDAKEALKVFGIALCAEAVLGGVGLYLYDGPGSLGEVLLVIDGSLTALTLSLAVIIGAPRATSYFSERDY